MGWLLFTWHFILAAGAVHLAIRQPESFRFRGDTLGIDLSLAWAGPILFGGFALLAGAFLIRQMRGSGHREAPGWNGRNMHYLWVVLAIAPVQFLLLRHGNPHGTTDQFGVLLILAQWGLLNASLFPWPAPEFHERTGTTGLAMPPAVGWLRHGR